MNTRWMTAVAVILVAGASSGGGASLDRTYTANYENVLGTSLELRVHTTSRAIANHVEQVVLGEIARQSRILSSWDKTSEVSRWTRTQGQPVHVSHELFEALDLFTQWRSRSHGVIDPAAQAVIAVWTKAAAEHRLPTDLERTTAVATVQQPHWTLDAG